MTQSYHNLAISISRRYLKPSQAFRPDEHNLDREGNKDKGEAIQVEQAGYSLYIKGIIYRWILIERSRKVASK
jgi:hypothetical protein